MPMNSSKKGVWKKTEEPLHNIPMNKNPIAISPNDGMKMMIPIMYFIQSDFFLLKTSRSFSSNEEIIPIPPATINMLRMIDIRGNDEYLDNPISSRYTTSSNLCVHVVKNMNINPTKPKATIKNPEIYPEVFGS